MLTPLRMLIAVCLAGGLTLPLAAQNAPPEAQQRAQEEQDRLPNTAGDGPYPAIVTTEASLPGHVIYRPRDLSPFAGGKLPVFVWGNGACVDDGTAHRFHLAEIASYGYLVIASGEWRSGPGAQAPRTRQEAPAGGGLAAVQTTPEQVAQGIDWAFARDADPASDLYGKIDRGAVGVGGHSCGGLQAIHVAADPRIRTVMLHNSGIFNEGTSRIPGLSASKAMLANYHTPVIYILGGPEDIAYANGMDDFARIDRVPVIAANLPVGHGGTFAEPMGGAVAHVAVDWLEWQLRGDKVAARTFLGENCRLCSGSGWDLQQKGF